MPDVQGPKPRPISAMSMMETLARHKAGWLDSDEVQMAARQIDGLLFAAREQDAKLAKLEADNARLLAALEDISATVYRISGGGKTCSVNHIPADVLNAARAAIEEAKR